MWSDGEEGEEGDWGAFCGERLCEFEWEERKVGGADEAGVQCMSLRFPKGWQNGSFSYKVGSLSDSMLALYGW